MAERQIEADEKPCPLTVGEWMGFLAAESNVKFRSDHMAVTVLLMFFSMVLAAVAIMLMVYAATDFESFRLSMRLVLLLIFCATFAVLMYYAYRAKRILCIFIDRFKEKDKNSEIIEEIIAGNLTDSDEIRKRWERHRTPANAEKLLKTCEKEIEIGWNVGKFFNLVIYSFRGNFKAIKDDIHFSTTDASETEKFIAVCENRRERAKILLSEIGPLIGFGVATMTGVALFARETLHISIYTSLLIFLFLCLASLFILLANYRIQVHAWTVFKEEVILRKSLAE